MENHLRKNMVGMIWVAGLILAAIVYLIGPDRILYAGIAAIDNARATMDRAFSALAINTFEVMRALALGLAPAFLVLCALASRRGIPYLRLLVVVAVLFLVLLYLPAHEGWYVSSKRWTVAFIAVAVGCAVMSRRLTFFDGGAPRGMSRAP
jgi:hypothetical protein